MGVAERFATRRVRVLAAVAVGAAIVLIGRIWLWPSEIRQPDPMPVLDVPSGEIVGGAAVDGAVVVVLSEDDGAGRGRTTLIRLDPTTGTERDRVVLGPWSAMHEVAEFDGDLVLRLRGRIPGVPGVLRPVSPADDVSSFETEAWLIVIDGETLVPIRQYELPPFRVAPRSREVAEPLVIVDGVYWMLGASSRRARIDLRSGETWFARDVFDRAISGVIELDGLLVTVTWGMVRVIDTETAEIVGWYQAEEYPPMMTDFQPVDFRVHENQVWVAPLIRDVEDLPLRLDLDTGALLEDRPSTSIPSVVVESGGSRWELIGRRNVPIARRIPLPWPQDRWRQADPETDEVVAVFDLGSWRPLFATPETLWVTRGGEDGRGSQLARIAVDSPSGGS